jgi:hypothetical protein
MELGAKHFKRGKAQTISRPKRGLLKKGTNPRRMLTRSLKECISFVMKWDIIPRVVTNPN